MILTIAEQLAEGLLAEDARAAGRPDGSSCAVCRRRIEPWDRIADLASGRGQVHVVTCAEAAGRRRG